MFLQVRNRERFGFSRDSVDNGAIFLPPSIQSLLAEDTGFQGDEEEEEDYSDDDESDSFNSTRTDLTFVPTHDVHDLSDEFCTARNSREQSRSITPTNRVGKWRKVLRLQLLIGVHLLMFDLLWSGFRPLKFVWFISVLRPFVQCCGAEPFFLSAGSRFFFSAPAPVKNISYGPIFKSSAPTGSGSKNRFSYKTFEKLNFNKKASKT